MAFLPSLLLPTTPNNASYVLTTLDDLAASGVEDSLLLIITTSCFFLLSPEITPFPGISTDGCDADSTVAFLVILFLNGFLEFVLECDVQMTTSDQSKSKGHATIKWMKSCINMSRTRNDNFVEIQTTRYFSVEIRQSSNVFF
uniref:Uncharacterized protein n=1 Tax=Romanomermis culicivorax TaxID=13658 RepID=A0A915HEW6_ROMCU